MTTNILSNTVFSNSITKKGGDSVAINSSLLIGNQVVFAEAGLTLPVIASLTGNTITRAVDGTSTTINAPLNDGTYFIYILDTVGNNFNPDGLASTASLTVDNIAPTPPLVIFPTGTTNNNTVTVILSSGANAYDYSINTGGTFTGGTGSSFTLPDDTYDIDKIQVRNSDEAGNESQTTNNSAKIIIDTVAPNAPSVTFPSGTTNNQTVTVTLASGATSYQFSTNSGANFSPGTGTSFSLSDGTYSIGDIQVKNTDAAGNVSTTTNNSSQITIDTVVPGPPSVTFPSQGLGNNNTVVVTLSSGATFYQYSLDSGVSFTNGTGTSFFIQPDGTYNADQIRVRNGDLAGNISSTTNNSYQIIVNTNIPDAPSVTFPSGTTNNNTVSVTLASGASSYQFSINSGASFSVGTLNTANQGSFFLTDNTYAINQIRVRNSDSAGNISVTTNNSAQFIIDTVAPSSPDVSFPSGITNNNVVTVTLASGATSYEFSVDTGVSFTAGTGTTFQLSDGTYSILQVQVKNSDTAGNISAATKNILPIVVDTIAPNPPSVTFPSGTTPINTVTVTLATGATSFEFSVDSGVSFTTGTGTTFDLTDGTYAKDQIRVKNTDDAGNTSTTTNNSSQIIIDTLIPDPPTIVFPLGTTNNNTLTIVLSSGAVSWEYSIDSGVSFVQGIGGTIVLANGTYIVGQIQFKNSDAAGNTSGETKNTTQFKVDTSISTDTTSTTTTTTTTTTPASCANQRKQRSQFFFHEAGSNVRFEPVSPYVKDQNGTLVYTPQQLDMRRKAEILKYKTTNNGNVQKNKYSQLSRLTKRNNTACVNTNILVPTSSSDVPGKVMFLKEDPNVPLYKYYSEQEQFQFQNIAYDNFKRLFDIFPINNIIVNVENEEPTCDVIILKPKTSELTFDFIYPVCINFNADYITPSPTTYPANTTAITAFNLSIFSAELQIFYSDSLIETKVLQFRSETPNETDLSKTTFTCSTVFDKPGNISTTGSVNLQTYMGTLQFKNIKLASVSQYVYTLKLNVKISYSEFDSITEGSARSNIDGGNISFVGERNLTNVSYNSLINIENSSVNAFNSTTNCSFELFNNPDTNDEIIEISDQAFVPFSVNTV